ncbi:hypothetical protein V6Z11_D09G039800 [Gossypium hirsutum]
MTQTGDLRSIGVQSPGPASERSRLQHKKIC